MFANLSGELKQNETRKVIFYEAAYMHLDFQGTKILRKQVVLIAHHINYGFRIAKEAFQFPFGISNA